MGKFKVAVETATETKELEIDERWLTRERKRIEDDYTFSIPKFGRVILSTDRGDFDETIARYKRAVTAYHKAVVGKLASVRESFEQKLVNEYLPRWQANPPQKLTRYTPNPTRREIEDYLREVAERLFADALEFEPPYVRVVYKNIAPESVRDAAFLKPLQSIMERRGVPKAIMASLFASSDAAPALARLEQPQC